MKILYLYFLKLFIKQILLIQTVILVLYTFFSLIGSMDMMGRYNASLWNVFYYEIIKIPQAIYDTLPITAVAATLLVIITLIKQNELIAFVSVGGKIRNLMIPFLSVGILLSGFLFFLSENINPKIELSREKYKTEVIKKDKFMARDKFFDLWIKGGDKVFINVDFIDPIANSFKGLTEYYLDDEYQVYKLKVVEEGSLREGKWDFINERVYEMNPIPKMTSYKPNVYKSHGTLSGLVNLPGDNHKYLNAKDFSKIIDLYEDKGLNVDRYLLYYYKMFAHPLSILVLILVVLPMSITLSRHHSYILIASRSLAAGFAYWIMNASFFSLSKTGIIGPFVANFLPHLLLSAMAIFFIIKREKGE